MSDPSSLRVADADREQLIDELREHAIAGRLTSEELEERIGGAYGASTRADVDALRADLPVSSAPAKLALTKRTGQLRRRLLREAGGSAGASLLSVGIWLATGPSGDFWPAWVIGITLLPVLRDARRLREPTSGVGVAEGGRRARHERHQARHERHRARRRRRHRYWDQDLDRDQDRDRNQDQDRD
jgi:hypothetical protein